MPKVGIIGGSGLYELLEDPEHVVVDTEYGRPSSEVSIGEIGGKEVAFMTRHGKDHGVPPHMINYRANLKALHNLGVSTLVTSSVVGSLRADYAPGDFVITDQYFDRTWGRDQTFYEGPKVIHVSVADPYCPRLHDAAVAALDSLQEKYHDGGTAVVIQGPRFSTRAESQVFQKLGFSVISMTQHPETTLARELGMCVCNLSFVSDLDAGVEGVQDDPVTAGLVWRTVADGQSRIKKALAETVARLEVDPSCPCHDALSDI
ncbi:MTAP family purine nucleoside phosphorylase [Actinotignum sanguinis]|nr:MTAP family purine nucleoside phosphorylase [Actinotignum sanguinis]MDE1553275.1 MTAP family purine nucleoside phosphorylase [Actinotignum sanguinis]MDE1565899.1 MTAP family purine nucleoside phosphorylase [Actinotignum sanguinis]MDE1577603.1 MTAP family purine nucleoside phosphorylase [Actinotignum sanguinis]